MAVNLSPVGGVAGQFFDNNGDPLVGGKLYTYAAGTTTPQTTFISSSGTTANSNPIILNGGGRVPSEIWLTDGLSYKFVLYSSTDQLIGSWDDISGINSNFVNFTSSQEIQTATSGQTVFTLTTMTYQPGTNSLTVYVDGVNQYGPGALYAYTETDDTTVTFNTGLHVGAEVKFTTIQQATSSATDASQVSYLPAGSGAQQTNVQTKLRETVSVKDFGAVGDGVTDDTAAIQAAIDYLDGVDGGTLVFPQGTYGITDTVFIKDNIKLLGQGRPEVKAIAVFTGAMIQFGFTTGVVTDPPTNPCSNAELNGFVVNADYKVTIIDYGSGLGTGIVYVWKNSPYNKIIDCEIKSAECGLVDVEDGADFFELRNCEIHDITSTSSATQFQNLVNIDGPTNAVIHNNDIYDLKFSGYTPVGVWGYALRLHATDTSTVSSNRLDTGYHNLLVDGRGNLITGNRCTNGAQSNIILFQNEFFCRYNTVIGNYCETSNRGIWEEDAGFIGRVSDNFIAFNTVRNVGFNTESEGQNATVFQNNVFNTSGVLLPKLDYFGSTYTPTLSNISNITSSTAYECQFTKINNVVTVSGKVDITPTGLGAFDLRITVPILTTFTDNSEAGGTAHDSVDQSACVQSQPTGSTVRVQGVFTGLTARSWWFTFTYRIV